MAPESLGESGEVNCIFLQKLCNPDEVPRSADPQADRHKMLCPQDARPYRPLGLVDLDFHLLCLSEGLRIEVAGDWKKPDGPSFDNKLLFPVLRFTLAAVFLSATRAGGRQGPHRSLR
jgi:hypothetical protein